MRASLRAALHFRPLVGLVCAVVLGSGGAAHAEVTIATVSNPTPVSFFAGRVAWSAFDPARNGYVLMTHAAGVTSPVPVPPRGVPFDADLGPDELGDTVAVYSRCGREPDVTGNGFPIWRTGRGCDIFKFSFPTGRETRVPSANGARSSEFLPSIWDTRIAFARVYERRRGSAGDRAYLYARPVVGTGRSLGLRNGPRGRGRFCVTPEGAEAVCGRPVETGPTALDLRGRRLAFSWETRGDCPATITGVWLDSVGGGRRRIDETCSTNLQAREVRSPTISGGRVHYVWSLLVGDLGTGSSFREYRISSRRRAELPSLRGRVVMWTATDAGRTFYLLSGGFMAGCSPVPGVPGAGAPCLLNELTSQPASACIPATSASTDATHNSRASVRELRAHLGPPAGA
jgi:hypothetical protein